jgi:peptidoglycan/xylan/chitin deacetylase (PgdA/CDA1 family)
MSVRSRLRIRTRLRNVFRRVWPPRPKPLILMYHRIADTQIDPWELAVSPPRFEEHLDLIRRTRHPLALNDFIRRLTAGTLPPNAVALTFDDGYVDNFIAGKPRLAEADVPATVFLTTGYLDRLEPFWWDELASLILCESPSSVFEVVLGGKTMFFDFSSSSQDRESEVLKRRRAALQAIWQSLRVFEDEERRSVMAKVRSDFNVRDHPANLGRAMTDSEVRALMADGLVTIGAHTVTHPVLSAVGAAACRREITVSKWACEALVGVPIAAFAYPYGDFDAQAREAVKAAGFKFACSTQPGPAGAASDTFALPRIHISNMDGDEFERVLRLATPG